MEVRIFTKEMSASEDKKVKDYSAVKIEQIERLLKHFAPDAIRLNINAEKLGRRSAYRVEFVLKVPSKTIVGREASHEITKAVDLAKDRVVRQIKKHEELLRSRGGSKKKANKKPHAEAHIEVDYGKLTSVEGMERGQKEKLFDIVHPYIEKLNKFIKRELLIKKTADEISAEEAESEGILNEVILEFYANYNPQLKERDLEQWLYTVAINKIRAALEQLESEGLHMIPIEETEITPKTDEEFEYVMPMETKSVLTEITGDEEEIIPTKIAKKKELSKFLMTELSQIEDKKREAFILHKLEGFLLAQISEMQHRPLKSVKKDVEDVQKILTNKAKQEFGEGI